ncbi:hypothetical protein [Clostridium tagluense]|uniref:Uncharacterized protein n=1 Tax=Clostridium tagluense TaxID=360422 RepID=A0A401UUF2_9CLOT|nr:hypothetical protein [Clostridium tagluense]GCD13180.1 hypothetical protein Ctaglu_48030 [Clostridium tagluense]
MGRLIVTEIKITDKEIIIIRVLESEENTFTTGVKEIYPLSENVKINIERNDKGLYRCIKGFSLEKCDDNGFTIEEEYETVEQGSIWHIPEDENYRFISGEIRLESDDLSWVEITKEHLEEYFEIVI